MSTAKIIPFAPESAESRAPVQRYRHLYRMAGRTIEFGETVKLVGIVVGGVLVVAAAVAYQLGRAAPAGFPETAMTLLGCAFLAVLAAHLWDRLFRARGKGLQEAVDALVQASTELTEIQRAEVRSLRRRAVERENAA